MSIPSRRSKSRENCRTANAIIAIERVGHTTILQPVLARKMGKQMGKAMNSVCSKDDSVFANLPRDTQDCGVGEETTQPQIQLRIREPVKDLYAFF